MSNRPAGMGMAILSPRLPPTEGEYGQESGGLRSEDGRTVVVILFVDFVPKKSFVFMTFQKALLRNRIPFSERLGSDIMSKLVLKNPDVKNIIAKALLDINGKLHRIGDGEWVQGLGSDVVYESILRYCIMEHRRCIYNKMI